jgi:hypothetical protein
MTGATCRASIRRNQNNGCIIYNGREKCTWQPSREYTLPKDCDQMIAHWRSKAGSWRDACCGFWTKVGRCRLTLSKPVLKAPLISILEATI